jgi:hypothetical protein
VVSAPISTMSVAALMDMVAASETKSALVDAPGVQPKALGGALSMDVH